MFNKINYYNNIFPSKFEIFRIFFIGISNTTFENITVIDY